MEYSNSESIITKKITDVGEAYRVLTLFKDYPFLEKVSEEEERRKFAEKWATQSDFLVSYYGEEVVGCFSMYTENTENSCAFITYIVTRSDIGMLSSFVMLDIWIKSIEITREKGLQKMRLEVDKANKKAQSPSKAIGFRYSGDASENTIFMEVTVDELEKRINKVSSLLRRSRRSEE